MDLQHSHITEKRCLYHLPGARLIQKQLYCIVFVFILCAISPCTTGLKELHDPFDCTSTAQLSNY